MGLNEGSRFETPGDVMRAIRERYLEAAAFEPVVELSPYVETALSSTARGRGRQAERQRTAAVRRTLAHVRRLHDESALSLAWEALGATLADLDPGRPETGVYCDVCGLVVAGAAVLTDLQRLYPDLPVDDAERQLDEAILAVTDGSLGAATEDVRRALVRVHELTAVVAEAERVWADAASLEFPDAAPTARRVRTELRDAIAGVDPERVSRIADDIEAASRDGWRFDHLFVYDAAQFEDLVAELWRETGAHASVARYSQDRNVDVAARHPGGTLELVQVKQYSRGHTVGISEVQRVAGLVVEFGADSTSLVTSSSFTAPALESAERMPQVRLFDGDELLDLLNRSSLVPPPTR